MKHLVSIEGVIVYDPMHNLEDIDSNRPVWVLSDKPVEVTTTIRADGRLEIYIQNA